MERTLMMASDGHGWTFGPYSSSECLFPMTYWLKIVYCGCGGCCDCDACSVACVYTERV